SKLLEPWLFSALRAVCGTRNAVPNVQNRRGGANTPCACSIFTGANQCKRVRSTHRSPRRHGNDARREHRTAALNCARALILGRRALPFFNPHRRLAHAPSFAASIAGSCAPAYRYIEGVRTKAGLKAGRKSCSLSAFIVSAGVGPVAPRAYWKGYLKLSFVSSPLALSPAASASERISFRKINKKPGNRLRQQLVD